MRKIALSPITNPNPNPNPKPNRGAIFLGCNCPDTQFKINQRSFSLFENIDFTIVKRVTKL